MTNPIINPQPNYSGVTIQIANPTVNAGPYPPQPVGISNGYLGCPQMYCYPQQYCTAPGAVNDPSQTALPLDGNVNESQETNKGYPSSYPAQYYLNNYNYQTNGTDGKSNEAFNSTSNASELFDNISRSNTQALPGENKFTSLRHYDNGEKEDEIQDFTKSNTIINDLDKREAKIAEKKKKTQEKKIIALTDEYIKSLENYLNNPNKEIRLMASKEVLTRLDEDKDRFDDAALNALLNKMLQDPSKLIRVAALSAFASQLASGNDYTVKLLHDIQSNPNADKEDVLQAADILLKMSSDVEIKDIPIPEQTEVKDKKNK